MWPPFHSQNRQIDLSWIGAGGACFITLCGPSLNENNLSHLTRRGVYTIGVNGSPAVVRPNAWVCIDPVDKFPDAIWLDPAVVKLVPSVFVRNGKRIRTRIDGNLVESVECSQCPGVVTFDRNDTFSPKGWIHEDTVNWGNGRSSSRNNIPRGLSVFPAALKVAYLMGFRTVYLLGADFHMSPESPYAFPNPHDPSGGGMELIAPRNNALFESVSVFMRLLLPEFTKAGFRVFNCNKRSSLTVFPFIDYEEAVDVVTGRIEQGPLNMQGWYTR